jgi:hypothetical protein
MHGDNFSDYLRRKVFCENEELSENVKYVSPPRSKHNIIVITFLLKIFYLIRELLSLQSGMTPERFAEIDRESLEYARKAREAFGYKIFKPDNNKKH